LCVFCTKDGRPQRSASTINKQTDAALTLPTFAAQAPARLTALEPMAGANNAVAEAEASTSAAAEAYTVAEPEACNEVEPEPYSAVVAPAAKNVVPVARRCAARVAMASPASFALAADAAVAALIATVQASSVSSALPCPRFPFAE